MSSLAEIFMLQERIDIIRKGLKNTPKCYKRLEVQREILGKYANDPRLLDLDKSILEKYGFVKEALNLSSTKEKNKEVDRILEKKKLSNPFRLETHSYAPEMNKLQYGSTFFPVPQKTTLAGALRTLTLEQLKIIK